MPDTVLHFGQRLARARREKNISLPAAAKELCIRRDLLTALEREDIQPFQSRAYAVGFLKTYAEYLEVNPAPLVLSLKKKFGPELALKMGPAALPERGGGLPVFVIVLLLALSAAGGWLGWQYWQDQQAAAHEGAGAAEGR